MKKLRTFHGVSADITWNLRKKLSKNKDFQVHYHAKKTTTLFAKTIGRIQSLVRQSFTGKSKQMIPRDVVQWYKLSQRCFHPWTCGQPWRAYDQVNSHKTLLSSDGLLLCLFAPPVQVITQTYVFKWWLTFVFACALCPAFSADWSETHADCQCTPAAGPSAQSTAPRCLDDLPAQLSDICTHPVSNSTKSISAKSPLQVCPWFGQQRNINLGHIHCMLAFNMIVG